MGLRVLAVMALALGVATPARAQLRTSLDVGAASVTYDGDYRSSAMSLTPTLELSRARTSVLATGSLSRFEAGGHSISGVVGASLLTSGSSRVRGELGLVAGGSTPDEGFSTTRFLGQLRLHVLHGDGGMWLGVNGGQAGIAGTYRGVRAGEAGGWWRAGTLLLTAALEPASVGDSGWVDVRANVRWERGPLEVGAAAGVRSGAFTSERRWQAIDATWWIGRFVALTAAGGSYLADPMQSTPGGRYVSVGVRLSRHGPQAQAIAELRRAARAPLLARPVADAMEVRAGAGARRVVVITAPGARTVELMGDFTEWRILSLASAREGRWEIALPIDAGTHRFNVRVYGGAWGAPRGVTTITDDFEGVVGILTVK